MAKPGPAGRSARGTATRTSVERLDETGKVLPPDLAGPPIELVIPVGEAHQRRSRNVRAEAARRPAPAGRRVAVCQRVENLARLGDRLLKVVEVTLLRGGLWTARARCRAAGHRDGLAVRQPHLYRIGRRTWLGRGGHGGAGADECDEQRDEHRGLRVSVGFK